MNGQDQPGGLSTSLFLFDSVGYLGNPRLSLRSSNPAREQRVTLLPLTPVISHIIMPFYDTPLRPDMTTYSPRRVISYPPSFLAILFFGMVFHPAYPSHRITSPFPWFFILLLFTSPAPRPRLATCDALNVYIIILRSGDTLMMLDSSTT